MQESADRLKEGEFGRYTPQNSWATGQVFKVIGLNGVGYDVSFMANPDQVFHVSFDRAESCPGYNSIVGEELYKQVEL